MALGGKVNSNPSEGFVQIGSMSAAPELTISAVFAGSTVEDIDPQVIITGDDEGRIPTITINFNWDHGVEMFGRGSILRQFENLDPLPEGAHNAAAVIGELTNTGSSAFAFTVDFVRNSAGAMLILVPAFVSESSVNPGLFGPTRPTGIVLNYNALIEEEENKPTLSISTPGSELYTKRSYKPTFEWSNFMLAGSFAVSHIDVDGAVIQSDSFTTVDMRSDLFEVVLEIPSGSGTVIITVDADVATDVDGNTGPPEQVVATFEYDNTLDESDFDIIGAEEIHCSETYLFRDNPFLDTVLAGSPAGGAFKGFWDIEKAGNYLYATLQIHKVSDADPDELSERLHAGAALVEVNLASNTCAVLKAYPFAMASVRSLLFHDESLYFFEGMPYLHTNKLAPPTDQYDWRYEVGILRSVSPGDSAIINHGINWRSRLDDTSSQDADIRRTYGVHSIAVPPMRSCGSEIQMITNYGDITDITSTDFETSSTDGSSENPVTFVDNFQWIVYGNRINDRIDVLETNGKTGWDILLELANLSASYIGFIDEVFNFKTRHVPRAKLQGAISDLSTTLRYDDENVFFPDTGFALIDGEVLSYTTTSDRRFLTIQRAQEGTPRQPHADNSEITYIDEIINANVYFIEPLNKIMIKQDTAQLFNVVKVNYGSQSLEVRDAISIDLYGRREVDLSFNLGRNHSAWVRDIAESYVELQKNIQLVCDITLKLSLFLRIGDVVIIKEPNTSLLVDNIPFQIIEISHYPTYTDIKVKTIFIGDEFASGGSSFRIGQDGIGINNYQDS